MPKPAVRSLAVAATVALVFASSTAAADELATDPATERTSEGPLPARDEPAKPNDDGEDRDAWRLGVVGGIGFPRPLMLEALLKIERVVGLGIEYSLLPKLGLGGVDTTFWALAADLRVFPFQNGFFLGLRGGYQRIAASATVGNAGIGTLTESATGESVFLNPRLRFLWTFSSGFTIGIDAGVQLPVSASITSTIPSGLVAELDRGIQKVANTLGHQPTPTVDLLRVGFLF